MPQPQKPFDYTVATPEEFINYLSKSLESDFNHQMKLAGIERQFEINKFGENSGSHCNDWFVKLGAGYPKIIIGHFSDQGKLLLYIDNDIEGKRLDMKDIRETIIHIISNEFKFNEVKIEQQNALTADCS